MLLAHLTVLLLGELVRQQLEQILWPRLTLDLHLFTQLALQLLTEIEHLAPEVILLTPAHEIRNLARPSVAVSHVEHHPLQPGYHVGTIGEDAIGLALVELRGVLVLLADVERQTLGLRALYQSRGSLQTVDVGLELLRKRVVVDAQHWGRVVIIVAADDGRDVQSADGTVIHHLDEELLGVGRCRRGIEVPPQWRYARDRIGTHALLTGIRVVEGLTDQQSHLVGRTLRRHLLQTLNLVDDGVDVALAVVVGIHDALVEDGIGQVVDQHLDTDIGRSGVLLLLGPGILLLPLGLALAVGDVALADVLHDILDGFLD